MLLTMPFVFFFASCVQDSSVRNGLHTLEAKVIYLKDGDSFIVLDEQKEKIEVRLIDMDAPELHQAYGKKAKNYLSKLIKGKTVGIDFDKKDKYGRILADVYLDSLYINKEMIRAGYAWHFTRFSDSKEMQEAEDSARALGKGL